MLGATSNLLKLPQEILDEILAEIDLHRHLVSFACVSKACTALVIPRHTEYRVLRIRHKLPAVWEHLARRADLARNIRQVHLCERHNQASSDRFPQTLLKGVERPYKPEEEDERVQNICKALGHMDKIQVFTWTTENILTLQPPPLVPQHGAEIIAMLVDKAHLKHVALGGDGWYPYPGHPNAVYSLWKLTDLTNLSLSGRVWTQSHLAPLLRLTLKSCPNLEALRIPMELTALSDIVLPHLKRVKIVMQSGAKPSIDRYWVSFLQRNKSIEDISWFPVQHLPSGISSNALPNLKRVHTNAEFLRALYASPRELESIDTTLEPSALVSLKGFKGSSVQSVRFGAVTIDPYYSLLDLAEACPNIRVLTTPDKESDMVALPLEMWLDIFSRLPQLHTFRGQALWASVKGDMDAMHLAIMKCVQRCPLLKELDHSKYDYKRGAYNKIVIIREEGDGEEEGTHVRYEVRRAPAV
ncbi:hypothetical protein CYLTODRAFT_458684 [Cylindrobasidium torrendii FP15055 ss-10]|uniref:F-box domain-containing protein n=1 Tax=Cylindrobasidium torrendii FP15055 ss-10 TaxID=1314674 RepID=A0A0D7AY45_9AGAR|nr:hypothetical protein CYLTODRAFT_458684 [Cylindrobasidium torrendii FP15055 ss-10]